MLPLASHIGSCIPHEWTYGKATASTSNFLPRQYKPLNHLMKLSNYPPSKPMSHFRLSGHSLLRTEKNAISSLHAVELNGDDRRSCLHIVLETVQMEDLINSSYFFHAFFYDTPSNVFPLKFLLAQHFFFSVPRTIQDTSMFSNFQNYTVAVNHKIYLTPGQSC